jgi:hypothetical protein
MSAFFILGIGLGLSATTFHVEKVISFGGQPKTAVAVSCGEPTRTLESQEQPSSAIEILEYENTSCLAINSNYRRELDS